MLYYDFFLIIFFLCVCVIVLLNTWIYYSIFSKNLFDLMDIFTYNFNYIFINEIGFIKKIVLVVGQINKK